ncbi:MAG: EI24 domain-containing protein [Acetobacteraceae bacterium]
MIPVLSPITRSLGQLDDRAFLGVVARGLLGSAACFVALHVFAVWAVHNLLGLEGMIAWAVDLLAAAGATLFSLWLFVPIAAAIATLFIDRVAAAVERRHYPALSPPQGAPLIEQVVDGIVLGLQVLGLMVLALILALLLPGVGVVLGWAIAAYALGRGLFVAVAMRRMPREQANALYRQNRLAVLVQGGIMAFAAWIPLVNLLIPVIGTAAMVHVLDTIMMQRSRFPYPN